MNQDTWVGRDLPPSSRVRDFGGTGRARRFEHAALDGAIALPNEDSGSWEGVTAAKLAHWDHEPDGFRHGAHRESRQRMGV
jgi:hypothetical protein